MKEWWSQRTVREQKLLRIAITVLSLIFLYTIILSPINNALTSMKTTVSEQQSLLQWMRYSVPQLQSLRTIQTSQQTVSASALLTTVDHTLTQSGIKSSLNEMKQLNDHAVQLKFTNTSFDDLITNLIDLQENFGIIINQVELSKSKKPGQVDGDILLSVEK